MIFLDVQVPSMNKIYDFELDEDTSAKALTRQVSELIRMTEGLSEDVDEERALCLYVPGAEQLLTGDETLRMKGIRTGDTLYLI